MNTSNPNGIVSALLRAYLFFDKERLEEAIETGDNEWLAEFQDSNISELNPVDGVMMAVVGRAVAILVALLHSPIIRDYEPEDLGDMLGFIKLTQELESIVSEVVATLLGAGIEEGYSNEELVRVASAIFGPYFDEFEDGLEDAINRQREANGE